MTRFINLKKVLGSEPAAVTGAIQALVGIFLVVGSLSPEGSATIMLVVSALTGAAATWATYDSRLTAVVEVVKAVLIAVTFFELGGLSFSPELQLAIVAAVTSFGSLVIRASTVPVPTPISEPTAATAALPGGPLSDTLSMGENYDRSVDDRFYGDELPLT